VSHFRTTLLEVSPAADRLRAHRDRRRHQVGRGVDHRHRIVFVVGDIDPRAIGTDRHSAGVRTDGDRDSRREGEPGGLEIDGAEAGRLEIDGAEAGRLEIDGAETGSLEIASGVASRLQVGEGEPGRLEIGDGVTGGLEIGDGEPSFLEEGGGVPGGLEIGRS